MSFYDEFYFDDDAIIDNSSLGTHVKLQGVSPKFKQWLEQLPIGEEKRHKGLCIFKDNTLAVSLNYGPNTDGIQIKKESVDYIVWNNRTADGQGKGKANLISFLVSLDSILSTFNPRPPVFTYNENAMNFTKEKGTYIRLQNVSPKFLNWLGQLPTGQEVKYEHLTVYKWNDLEVTVNTGAGTAGIRINRQASEYIVYNNQIASRLDEVARKANLSKFLFDLENMVANFESKREASFPVVNERSFGCTMDGCSIS